MKFLDKSQNVYFLRHSKHENYHGRVQFLKPLKVKVSQKMETVFCFLILNKARHRI